MDTVDEFDAVAPSEFSIILRGKKRAIRFGNLALAKIEKKYGTLSEESFKKLEEDMQQRPMQTMPWLLTVCMKDREGIGDGDEDILEAMDDSNISITEIATTISSAMTNSLNNMFGIADKKKAKGKK